jgi:hypothetical protein
MLAGDQVAPGMPGPSFWTSRSVQPMALRPGSLLLVYVKSSNSTALLGGVGVGPPGVGVGLGVPAVP